MREVLYRAKPLKLDVFSPDDQKRFAWVYGSPLINRCRGLSVQIFEHRDGKLCNWECNPETLGQWSGLTDKNGQKIFEGDIVKLRDWFDCEWLAVVEFGQQRFKNDWGWKLRSIKRVMVDMSIMLWVGSGDTTGEVIGNIHDNPELLEDS